MWAAGAAGSLPAARIKKDVGMDVTLHMIPGGSARIGKIQVKIGQTVAGGDELAQMETQKGSLPVMAPCDGTVAGILCAEGDDISAGVALFRIQEESSTEDAGVVDAKAPAAVPSERLTTDLLILGGGPGGYVAALYAARKGLSVIVAEKDTLGGTCLNRGCIPTKALVKASSVYKTMRGSGVFGIGSSGASLNMARIMARKDEVKAQLVGGVEHLMRVNGIRVLRGEASFTGKKTVRVKCTGQSYDVEATDVIIATGSKASGLNIPGADLPCVMDSTAALEMTALPASLTVIGGGVIGMEFAFIWANFGADVTVLEYLDRTLPMLDRDVSAALEERALASGIAVHTASRVVRIEEALGGKAVVVFEQDGKERLAVSDTVLMAVGRVPFTEGLDLEAAGIALNENGRGVSVDACMRTNVPHMYAIGDVTGGIQLAHVASHQGMAAVDTIVGTEHPVSYNAVPNVIFTDPEIASVGLTLEECARQGIACRTSRFPFRANGKAMTMGQTEGFAMLVCEKESGVILGGSIIGPDAPSLIAAVGLAVTGKLTDADLRHTMFAHPTTSEVLHECALGLSIGALHYHDGATEQGTVSDGC